MNNIDNIINSEPWTTYEEYLVLSHIIPDEQLSEFINRSVNSINCKRKRLIKNNVKGVRYE